MSGFRGRGARWGRNYGGAELGLDRFSRDGIISGGKRDFRGAVLKRH